MYTGILVYICFDDLDCRIAFPSKRRNLIYFKRFTASMYRGARARSDTSERPRSHSLLEQPSQLVDKVLAALRDTKDVDARSAKHERLVYQVATKLEQRGYWTAANKKYCGSVGEGQLDVLAITIKPDGVFFTYYEIKSADNKDNLNTGSLQIRRWKNYMTRDHHIPERFLDGVVITPKNIDDLLPWL